MCLEQRKITLVCYQLVNIEVVKVLPGQEGFTW